MSHVQAGPPLAFGELAMRHRLTLVVAGAGWGKSAMLRGLTATFPSIEVRRPASGWTPFALAHALVDGIAEHTQQSLSDNLPAYPTAESPDSRDQITALATNVCDAASTSIDSDTLIVLDDVDVTDDDPVVTFLEPLILGLPPKLHLVLACRTQPNLRIARLRAAGEVARIGPGTSPSPRTTSPTSGSTQRRRHLCSTSFTPPAAGHSPCISPSRSPGGAHRSTAPS